MGETIHILEHALGLCGERHTSIFTLLLEWPNLHITFTQIKTLFK
jgi:hypothetical protein